MYTENINSTDDLSTFSFYLKIVKNQSISLLPEKGSDELFKLPQDYKAAKFFTKI